MKTKKKKIAILGAQIPFNYGGAEILVDELNRQLNDRGFQSEVINIPFKWYPKEQLIDNALVWKMTDLTESNGEKIDQVICTKYPTYAIDHPNKVVWLFHQHRPIYDLLGTEYSEFSRSGDDQRIISHIRQIDSTSLTQAKKIFSISENVKNRLKIYNNISSEILYPPAKLDGSYRNDHYGDYIFSAGRLDPLKRLDLLILALKKIDTNVTLKIAGKGKYGETLERLAIKEGVSNRIEFLGFVPDEDLIDHYAKAGAVFFAPLDEDYGFITIEAFKSRKPIVTTNDSGGVLEFVEDGINGYVVNTDPNDIADAFNYIFKDKKKQSILGEAGLESVKMINWDHVITTLTK